jgi:hypothetical protein
MSALPSQIRRKAGALLSAPFVIVLILFVFGVVRRADADQIQTLPSQQNIPQVQGTPLPLHRQPGGTLPIPPNLPGSQGNTREIPLPRVFHGCWQGEVARVDSIEPLQADAGRIAWLTKSYTLCYKQTRAGGRWELTFAEGSVSDRAVARDQRQSIKVKSVISPQRAELTAYLHFRAPQLNMFGQPTGEMNTLDELTSLDCQVVQVDGAMQVRAQVFVEMDDQPYARINWHTSLRHTIEGSE